MSVQKGAIKRLQCLSGKSENCAGKFLTTPEVRICSFCKSTMESFAEPKVVDRSEIELDNFWRGLR